MTGVSNAINQNKTFNRFVTGYAPIKPRYGLAFYSIWYIGPQNTSQLLATLDCGLILVVNNVDQCNKIITH